MPALCPIFLMTRADFSSDDGSKPIEPADSTEWSFQAADAKQEQSKTFNSGVVYGDSLRRLSFRNSNHWQTATSA